MKKIILPLVFAVLAMLSFNNATTASTTISFKLYVDDGGQSIGCSMPYSGYYYVNISIIVNGTVICQHEQYNIINSYNNPISWVCDRDFFQSSHYTVTIDICRYDPNNTPPLTCCTSGSQSDVTMAQLTGGTWVDRLRINY
jgi:hypothetical protein